MATEQIQENVESVVIAPLNMREVQFTLIGTSPLVINHFGKRKQGEVLKSMTDPDKSRSKKNRPPKNLEADFKNLEADFKDACYVSHEGWYGLNAAAIRNACISACRVTGYQMTKAKLSVFVIPDGLDKDHNTPLMRIHGQEPKMYVANVRNESGVIDIRARPMWVTWEIRPNIEFDADQFKLQDVTNLLTRAGRQVGLGEGRHDSRKSGGLGYGCFRIKEQREEKQ